MEKNGCFQNSLTNTCKNEAGKPVFTRVSRGYCRNEVSPFRALTHQGRSRASTPGRRRNEVSPFRALTPESSLIPACQSSLVEMKLARSGH